MGKTIKTTITCDRCNKPMAESYGHEWTWFDHRKKPFYKLCHDIPGWIERDEFLLCDECAWEFKQWMLEKKSANS